MTDYADFASMRAELMRDYNPINAQERLLVLEFACAWRRLSKARKHEELFFDLQRHREAIKSGASPEKFQKPGVEVVMWAEKPHRAYDQILRAIRDAGLAFDRAIHRLEIVMDHRFRRERLANRDAQAKEVHGARISALRARTARAAASNSTVPRPTPIHPPLDDQSAASIRKIA